MVSVPQLQAFSAVPTFEISFNKCIFKCPSYNRENNGGNRKSSSCHCDMTLYRIIAGVKWDSKCNIFNGTPDYNKHLINYSYFRIPCCAESLWHRVWHTGLLYLCSWELETYNLKLMAVYLCLKSNPVSLCLGKNKICAISNGSNLRVKVCQILVAPSTGPWSEDSSPRPMLSWLLFHTCLCGGRKGHKTMVSHSLASRVSFGSNMCQFSPFIGQSMSAGHTWLWLQAWKGDKQAACRTCCRSLAEILGEDCFHCSYLMN